MSRTDAGLPEGTQRTSGSNSRKGGRSGRGSSSHSDDHSGKRKPTQQTRYNNNGGGRSNNGGRDSAHTRDSAHSHKSTDNRYKTTTEYTDSIKHGKGGASSKDGGHHGSWHKTHRSSEGQRGNKGGHNKTHSAKSTKVPPLEGQDSGISVGENISPDSKRSPETGKEVSVKEDITTVPHNDSNIADNENGDVLTEDVIKKEKASTLVVYDRKLLLELKNSITSLVTPIGFDQLPPEIAKDILKTSRRYSESESKDDVSEARNDDVVKHTANSLSLNRDHSGTDQKGSVKVSLMPQRRSFGSGCSWRDHPSSKASTSVSTTDSDSNVSNTNTSTTSTGTGWTTVTSSSGHHHPPRVIDHVPYRSRPNQEWKGASNTATKGSSSWRANRDNTTAELNEDEEPEWMSFSPSDEMMELKGIDEHELEREARKSDKAKPNEEERLSSLVEESPSSSPVDKQGATDLVDSGLPSSCPNDDDEDGFILDGFDFKNVLSMCRELDSDDGDTPTITDHVDKDSLCKAKDTNELKNALISVLGITKEMAAMGSAGVGGHNPTLTKQQPEHGRPLTLDEIEGHIPVMAAGSHDNIDQTAFNRFLASMSTSTATTPSGKPTKEDNFQLTHNTNKTELIGSSGLTKSLKQNPLLSDDSQYSVHTHTPSSPSTYHPISQSNKQPHPLPSPISVTDDWPLTSSTSSLWSDTMPKPAANAPLLNPSPSSLGMSPHHKYHSTAHTNTGMIPSPSSSGSGNTNWVTEMEQIRISELNQMKHPLASSNMRDERAMKMHQQQQQHLTQQKGSGYGPSLSFLPTSVMRHMHNSKPNQPIKDIRGKIPASKRLDQDYPPSQSTEHAYSPRSSIPPEGMYHGSAFQYPSPPPPPHYHYPPMATPHPPPPPLQYPYRSSMRPMGGGEGYHIPSPHHHPMPGSHYVGMGSLKPAGNY